MPRPVGRPSLPGILLVGNQHPLAGLIHDIPTNVRDLILPPRREQREHSHPQHVDLLLVPVTHLSKEEQQFIQLNEPWPTCPLLALGHRAHLAQRPAEIRHCQGVNVITPSGLLKAPRQVNPIGLRLDAIIANSAGAILNQWLRGNLRVLQNTPPGGGNCFERGALGFAQRPDLFLLSQVALDHLPDRHAAAICFSDRTRFCQLSLTPLDPRLRSGLAIEGLAFLINCRALLHDPDLRSVARNPVLALADSDSDSDRAHDFATRLSRLIRS
jgi:hypothetical protein